MLALKISEVLEQAREQSYHTVSRQGIAMLFAL